MMEPDQAKLRVLRILKNGRLSYAQVQAEYQRLTGTWDAEAAVAFDFMVQGLIAEKLIDYEAEGGSSGPTPIIATLWLRPRGRVWLDECNGVA